MPTVFVFCLISVVLATVSSQGTETTALQTTRGVLNCTQCVDGEIRCARSVETPCMNKEDVCLSVYEANTLAKGKEDTGLHFNCVTPSTIPGNITLFFGNDFYLRILFKTCTTSNCNSRFSPDPDLAISNMYNGKACPSCYAPGHKSCGNNGTIHCEGAIDQCAYITGTVSEGNITIPFAARGCASAGACNIKPKYQLKSGVFQYMFETVSCIPAPNSAVQTRIWGFHLLPSLAGLLLVKSIY